MLDDSKTEREDDPSETENRTDGISIDQRLKTTRQIRPAEARATTQDTTETAGFRAPGVVPAGSKHAAADGHPGVKIG